MTSTVEVARSSSERGEVILLRRERDGALELRVNGVFVMDTAETATERLLARTALQRAHAQRRGKAGRPLRVFIGGLGLGFTLDEVLRDATVTDVVVVEIEGALVDWHRAGLIPHSSGLLDDPRVRVVVGDVVEVIGAERPESVDVIVLDVDNGPGFLVYDANAGVYQPPFLRACHRASARGGVTALWSSDTSPALSAALSGVFAGVKEQVVPVRLGARETTYHVFLATKHGRGERYGEGMSDDQPDQPDQPGDQPDYRIERDTMGEVKVPAWAKWRAQTQRAVDNFPISGTTLERDLIGALASIKGAAATVNAELGVLDDDVAKAVHDAAAEVASGAYDEHFPIDVFQTGSGTSSNMNMNEVIATLAAERLGRSVHPNDDVNASQSSNDTFPTAMHVAATRAVVRGLRPALEHLAGALEEKAAEFEDVVKAGRTHLMDATPVTLGQEFSGYAAQVRYGIERLDAALPRVAELPLGGTAVGTGINTPPGFAAAVIQRLADDLHLPLTEARNHFEAQGSRDALVEASGQLRTIAVGLYKICTDLRWMGSGPRAGLGEIRLPDLQPGSSIMPGKVNPVLAEATSMVCAQVIGNDAAIAFAGASGNFELNVMMPVMAANLLQSIRLLSNASRLLADRCVDGIEADVEHCRELAESSPSIVTALNRYLGYENAAAVAKRAVKERRTIRDVVIEDGYVDSGALTEQQLDEALDVLGMTYP
ncbi:MAG: aspartate ammonia-lyase [Propionibacteriales bacterium]|nr:aspartate ammonia-lyase [Propionibacteriales bacterium]